MSDQDELPNFNALAYLQRTADEDWDAPIWDVDGQPENQSAARIDAFNEAISDLRRWKEALLDAATVDWVLSDTNRDDPQQLILDIVARTVREYKQQRDTACQQRDALAAKAKLLDECIQSGAISPSSDAYDQYDELERRQPEEGQQELAWRVSPMASENQPEPSPKANSSVPIWDLVIADMRERDQMGRAKYGTPLQANNGRDALTDAYQEALDLCVYLRQAIEERQK